ncbi:MAG: helix-turn-helix domain-containing protein [Blastomonas sp.]
MSSEFDFVMRLLAMGAALLLLATLMVGPSRPAMKVALAGLLSGAICYLLNATRLIDPWRMADRLVDLVSLMTPYWTWVFAALLFDRKLPRPLLFLLPLLYLIFWYCAHFITPLHKPAFVAIHLLSLLLIAHLVFFALSGRNDDLIEKRRWIRLFLPLAVGLQAGGILVYELIIGVRADDFAIQSVSGLLIFVIIMAAGMALLVSEPDLLVAQDGEAADDDAPPPSPLRLSPSEAVLNDKLTAAMADGYYRTPGLTIDALATHLGSAEHRLRALINRRLGHRNFSSFLNGYRIAEACEKLADRDLVDMPILTIAMDLGYNSLPTFNRAFRAETGTAPSDFRRDAIGRN